RLGANLGPLTDVLIRPDVQYLIERTGLGMPQTAQGGILDPPRQLLAKSALKLGNTSRLQIIGAKFVDHMYLLSACASFNSVCPSILSDCPGLVNGFFGPLPRAREATHKQPRLDVCCPSPVPVTNLPCQCLCLPRHPLADVFDHFASARELLPCFG